MYHDDVEGVYASFGQDTEENKQYAGNCNNQAEEEEEGDENGEEAAWAQVDELMDTVQLKDQRILELEKNLATLQRDLQAEKDRSRSSNGLTRAAAVKLEREFLSQEMILKGLQRDNEDKTLEVENLRRKVKIMSDFLARQYGADDWESVVQAASGSAMPQTGSAKDSLSEASPHKESLSAVARVLGAVNATTPRAARAKVSPMLSDEGMNPFSPSASSPSKAGALNMDDVLIPTIARLQTPASSPSKHSAFTRDATTDQEEEGPSPAAPLSGQMVGLDPKVLLASIESVRLLIQGFERKNAMRRAELEKTIESAIEAERRAERLQANTSTQSRSHEPAPVAAS